MNYYCVSLCSLWDVEEVAKEIYISLLFVYYRNWNKHAADCLFGSNGKDSVGFGRMQSCDYTTRLRLQ